jgi:glycosyltransferase involved in cell wall biosynthesis
VVVHGETGLLVPPRAPQELATAITDLILDEEKAKRMGQAGRKRVNPEFSVETMVEKIDKLYCSLIQAKRASVLERK